MTVLTDLANEINNYAADFVTLTIAYFVVTGAALNVGEQASFSIHIENNGDLDVKKLELHIKGSQYGEVSDTSGGPYDNEVWSPLVDLDAQSTGTVGPFFFHADQATTGSSQIISAHVSRFDLSFNYLLVDHTGHTAAASDSFSTIIYPS